MSKKSVSDEIRRKVIFRQSAIIKSMSQNELKDSIVIILLPIILSVVCITIAVFMLPEYCAFFSDNIPNGFACDGIDFSNPQSCPVCYDTKTATIATIFMGFGLAFLTLPFVIYTIKNKRNSAEKQTKLFNKT